MALIQRGTCDFFVKAENAEAAGYDAAIIFNEGQEGRQETLAGTLSADDHVDDPGDRHELRDRRGAVQPGHRLAPSWYAWRPRRRSSSTCPPPTCSPTRRPAAPTGRSWSGAHLDSVPEGPGINDNGSGGSQNLEIALQMAELGIAPRNQVRFAWWGAEESGLIGSQFYVDSLTARQMKDIAVNLNFDMVGSPNFVRFVYDGDASDTDSLASTGSGVVEDVFLDYFASQGLASRADGVRRPLGLRRVHQRRDPRRWHCSPAPRGSRRRRRLRSTAVRPESRTTLATTRRATTIANLVEHGARRDVGRRRARDPRRSPRPRRRSRAPTRARPRATPSKLSSRARR